MVGQYSLWVICEALDAIFDTFADGPLVNAAADSIGLMINLQQLVPVLKARVRNSLMYAGGVDHLSGKKFGGHSVLDFQAFFIHSSFAPPLKVSAH